MSEGAFALLAGPMAEAGENGHDPTKLISFFAQARLPSVCRLFRTLWVDWGGAPVGRTCMTGTPQQARFAWILWSA